jgi:hypothetical protein
VKKKVARNFSESERKAGRKIEKMDAEKALRVRTSSAGVPPGLQKSAELAEK